MLEEVRAKWRGKKILGDKKYLYSAKSYFSINIFFGWNPYIFVT
jgi:hypothetical protein